MVFLQCLETDGWVANMQKVNYDCEVGGIGNKVFYLFLKKRVGWI